MRFNTLAFRLGGFAFLVGVVLAGCKSSSTSGGGSSDSNKPDSPKADPNAPSNDVASIRLAAVKRLSINNLIQIGIGLHTHHDAHGKLPSAGLPAGSKIPPNAMLAQHSWRLHLLPFIEQENLFKLVMEKPQGPLPEFVSNALVKTYTIPLDGRKEQLTDTHYRVFVGNGAAFDYGQGARFAQFSDGLSNTIFVVEAADPVRWSKVDELVYDPKKPLPKLGVFAGGFHALMGDGSVRWIPSDTDERTIRLMITRADGQAFTLPGKRMDKEE